jgi:hypothetical protein
VDRFENGGARTRAQGAEYAQYGFIGLEGKGIGFGQLGLELVISSDQFDFGALGRRPSY